MGAWQQRSQAGPHRRCDEISGVWLFALIFDSHASIFNAHRNPNFVLGIFFLHDDRLPDSPRKQGAGHCERNAPLD
jgi:hypothetical protein